MGINTEAFLRSMELMNSAVSNLSASLEALIRAQTMLSARVDLLVERVRECERAAHTHREQ